MSAGRVVSVKCRLAYNGCSVLPVRTKGYHQQASPCLGGSPLILCVCTAYISNDNGVDVQVVWISRRSEESSAIRRRSHKRNSARACVKTEGRDGGVWIQYRTHNPLSRRCSPRVPFSPSAWGRRTTQNRSGVWAAVGRGQEDVFGLFAPFDYRTR